jgi:molybdopterin converting factor small subunit
MLKVRAIYASVFELPQEEIELATGSFIELKEKVIQKLGDNALCFASAGKLIFDSEATLINDQEIFIFPIMSGG